MIREDARMREAEIKYLRSEEADEDEELGLDVEARAVAVKMEKVRGHFLGRKGERRDTLWGGN